MNYDENSTVLVIERFDNLGVEFSNYVGDLNINWGDDNENSENEQQLDDFVISYVYKKPGIYTIELPNNSSLSCLDAPVIRIIQLSKLLNSSIDMFKRCYLLEEIDELYIPDNIEDCNNMFVDCEYLTTANIILGKNIKDCHGIFSDKEDSMFGGCKNLEHVTITFNSIPEKYEPLFYGCNKNLQIKLFFNENLNIDNIAELTKNILIQKDNI